ncbi:MAG: FAD-dependent oxidoreductase [Wenzhouxiangellaceae bacterium]|nr:FAD-dependent oxidoreductase [Wenzhouxiangellaceae bacterium]
MRIAVIGGGVAGLYAAWHLAKHFEVTLLEKHGRIGGHTDTHVVEVDAAVGPVSIDTGFIVFNHDHYPLFSDWLDRLGVASRESDMSFGMSCQASGLEYNATSLNRLFCQRRNLLRPAFLGMVRDILRFYRSAPDLLERLDESLTLGDWLENHSGLGRAFGRDHLVPMAAALWSSPADRIIDFPMVYLLEFMQNHNMLQVAGRPQWRTISGGSQRYVEAALERFEGRVITGCQVTAVQRRAGGNVRVTTPHTEMEFDQLVMACHADQALELLDRPSNPEREVLGAFEYQANETVLHTDRTRLPANRRAWASWNVRRDGDASELAGISYYMNALQGLPGETDYIVSLNQTGRIDPARMLVRRDYRHPVYTPASRRAQQRLAEINGVDRIWYAGACWGWGFHEDAVASAARVVNKITDTGADPGVCHAA